MDVKDEELSKQAADCFSKAKLALLGIGGNRNDSPQAAFFAHLAFKLQDTQATHIAMRVAGGTRVQPIPTAATDGKYLWYNPNYILSLLEPERIGVICHEDMHCACGHFRRLMNGVHWKKQIAFDLAINSLIIEAGFTLPKGRLLAGEDKFRDFPSDLSAEEYYLLLTDEWCEENLPKPGSGEGEGGEGEGQEGDGPGGCGAVFIPDHVEGDGQGGEASNRSSASEMEQEWKMATAEAAQLARRRGTLPGSLQKWIDTILATPKLDWKTLLAQFLASHCRNDFSWNRPSKKSHLGVVLPVLHSEHPGHIAVAVDTSGSTYNYIADFFSELAGIMSCLPTRVTIIWHDYVVYRIDTWEPTDAPFKVESMQHGGTSHVPVFKAIERMDEQPVALVCLTDLETSFPDYAPEYPVMWITSVKHDAPFGEVVEL